MKVVSLILISSLLTSCWTTQEGYKHGVLVKVAKAGVIWGTYEGELITGGLTDATGVNGLKFDFTFGRFKSKLIDSALIALSDNQSITLHYHCELFIAPWRGGHGCFADSIKINKEQK